MSFRALALSLCLVLALPVAAAAGGFCCQMPAGVIEGLHGGAAAGAGKFQLQADYSYSRMERFYEGDDHVSFSSVVDDPRFRPMMGSGVVPEYMDMHRVTLTGSYAPTDRLRFSVAVPYIINKMSMQMYMMGKWTRMVMDDVTGLGDVTAYGLYTIYRDRDIMPLTVVSAGVGLKFPTGSWTESQGGKRVHAHMQPGTGSWDPILTVGLVKMIDSEFLVQADATYQITTENNLGYEFGDTLAVNAALKYNAVEFLNLSLGLNYFHSEQADDRQNSYKGQVRTRLVDFVGNSGEDSVWVSPGLQVIPLKNASLDFKFQYPLYYSVGGIQQVTDYRVLANISYTF